MHTQYYIFQEGDVLLKTVEEGYYSVPLYDDYKVISAFLENKNGSNFKEQGSSCRIHDVGPFEDGAIVKAISLNNRDVLNDISGYEFIPLRQTYDYLVFDDYLKAGKCREILHFFQTNQFCGVCATPMSKNSSISVKCPKCGREIWPSLNIATICLIHKDDEILLVHPHSIRGNYYGLVAGFVETGETLEQGLRREIKEEVGLEVDQIEYFGSQPWPYPSNLMCGFFAKYSSGEIKLQEEEIAKGGWYEWYDLPPIPGKLSIARQLIDEWVRRKNAE